MPWTFVPPSPSPPKLFVVLPAQIDGVEFSPGGVEFSRELAVLLAADRGGVSRLVVLDPLSGRTAHAVQLSTEDGATGRGGSSRGSGGGSKGGSGGGGGGGASVGVIRQIVLRGSTLLVWFEDTYGKKNKNTVALYTLSKAE